MDSWLKEAKKQIPALDAELIAVRCFAPRKADRSWLVTHKVVKITAEMRKKPDKMVQRRKDGEPLAYILGEKEFFGRNFMVNKAVLIPRPETEDLIRIIQGLKLPKYAQFLEIGTGSGCIAVTLALEFPQSYVLASDVSVRALDVANKNDLYYEGRVELVQSNLLQNLGFAQDEHFDVLVANLPYVNRAWKWVDEQNLRFEPSAAIYAKGDNGLSAYRRLFADIRRAKADERNLWVDYIVVEADPCQHEALKELAERYDLIYLRTEGYGLLFEDCWRYWYDPQTHKYLEHKPEAVIQQERITGDIAVIPEQMTE